LKLLSADFVTSAAAGGRTDGIPRDGLGQIALAGRSNVGKSSLLNALCKRAIARTSAAPGKTRLANVYRITLEGGGNTGPGRWGVYLVDLPGYGYARGGADSAAELAVVADAYFATADADMKAGGGARATLHRGEVARFRRRGAAGRRHQGRQAVALRADAQPQRSRAHIRHRSSPGLGDERRRIG
jgi:hypothetical protein